MSLVRFQSKAPMREWLSGRASPCQGERREFESRLPLQKQKTLYASFVIWRHSQVVRQRPAKPLSPVQVWVAPPEKSVLNFQYAFFNEINPFRICEMHFVREILLRNMKYALRRVIKGFILFHRKRSFLFHNFTEIISHRA